MQVGVLTFSVGGKEGVRATYKITNRSRAALRRLEVRSMRRDEAGGQPGPNLTYQRCKAAGQRGENLLLEATHSKNWTKTYSNDAENVIMEADTGYCPPPNPTYSPVRTIFGRLAERFRRSPAPSVVG